MDEYYEDNYKTKIVYNYNVNAIITFLCACEKVSKLRTAKQQVHAKTFEMPMKQKLQAHYGTTKNNN